MAGYIGSAASVVSSGAENKKTFTITGSTTSLTGLKYPVGKVHVFQNGVRLVDGTDYTATNGNTITLTVAAQSGDNVVVISQAAFQVADALLTSGGTLTGDLTVQGTVAATAVTGDGSGLTGLPAGVGGANGVIFNDNVKAQFGAGSDLQIYHDGTHSYLDNNTGALFMRNNGSVVIEDLSGDNIIRGIDGGAVDLYHNGSSKLATTATGVDVTGVMTANGTVNSSQAEFGTSSNRPLIIRSSNVGGYADDLTEFHKNSGVGQFSFSNTGGEMMRIKSSGDVLIGGTNTLPGVNNTDTGHAILNDGRYFLSKSGNTVMSLNRNTNDGIIAEFRREGSTKGSISISGSSTSFNTSSDYRLKENVVDLTGASARVNQLNPSRFNWIADDTNTLVDGFLAHEVATVVPEAIHGTKDAMMDEEYEVTPAVLDDDGNVTTEAVMGTRSVPKYQGIDQSKLVPLLTAALQEALTEIASLKTRVEALEA
ncbi:tail fiber domain-containing protein [Akkermansiaceae bacterium]|nr:tail fiber domain-containing protein [Akkermansiaceae bacterium]